MKKIFKSFSLILLLSLCLFAICACKNPGNDPGNGGDPSDNVTSVTLNLVATSTTNSTLNSDNSNYATLPDLTNANEDLEFSGWALSADGDVVIDGKIRSINYNTIKNYINGNELTLYAIYKSNKIEDMIDYASEVKLDYSTDTLKQEVTVKNYVDGDTTHFYVPTTVSETGVLKARYIAINTPESTGKIEEYGKTAAYFTKEKLLSAVSIVVESDDNNWNIDSTGSRYLVWIWYKTSEDSDYRNLNIEILQNGLAIASSSANNRYGETCVAAINQAKQLKLNIYSGEKDPNFYYGEAVELTLAELRQNIADYNGVKVAFEAVVIKNYNNSAYVEEYDEETGMYNGISVYYGTTASGDVINILSTGNRVRIVGSVQFYETGGTYQVSGITYRAMRPNDPSNTQCISSGHTPSYTLTDMDTFLNKKVTVERIEENEEGDEELVRHEYKYSELSMNASIEMKDLRVVALYTTEDESSSSYGAISITCKVGDLEIVVRTVVLYDTEGHIITQDIFENKTINVKGLVDFYNGSYQIKVFSIDDITIQ